MNKNTKIETIEKVMMGITGLQSNALRDFEVVRGWYYSHEDELDANERKLVRTYIAYAEMIDTVEGDIDELLNETFDESLRALRISVGILSGIRLGIIATEIVITFSPINILVKVVSIGLLLMKSNAICVGLNKLRSIFKRNNVSMY